MRSKVSGLGLFITFMSLTAYSANPGSVSDTTASEDVTITFLRDQLVRQRRLDFLLAPIKSEADLHVYLEEASKARSPLSKLSPTARARFLDSLRFNENGLVGYDYADLVAELRPTEIYEILSLFGAQRTTSMLKGAQVVTESDELIMATPNVEPDYHDYWCSSPHTCDFRTFSICMRGC